MCYFSIMLNIFFSWSKAEVFLRELLANPLAKKLGFTKFENKGGKEYKIYQILLWNFWRVSAKYGDSAKRIQTPATCQEWWKPRSTNAVLKHTGAIERCGIYFRYLTSVWMKGKVHHYLADVFGSTGMCVFLGNRTPHAGILGSLAFYCWL